MLTEEEKATVRTLLSDLLADKRVQQMKKYIQHGTVTTYDHCLSVAYRCYEMARGKRGIDMPTLLTAAMLHDFYLYDWHESDPSHRLHGFHHAYRAAENATREFSVSPKVRRIIYCHMWPLTPARVPDSREAWIVTLADKWVSFRETFGLVSDSSKTSVASHSD